MDIQSLIFPKEKYDRNSACYWARLNDFKHNVVNESETAWILVQKDESLYKSLETTVLREEEAVSATSGTVSTDIAIPDTPLYKRDDKGKICPDSHEHGYPCFEVESEDYFRASTYREKGARYKINNEKVKAFMRESGYRSPFLIKYSNNFLKVK